MQSLCSTPNTYAFDVLENAIKITLPIKLLTSFCSHETGPPRRHTMLISGFGSPRAQAGDPGVLHSDACFCICDFSWLACATLFHWMKSSFKFLLKSLLVKYPDVLTEVVVLLLLVAFCTHLCHSIYHSLWSMFPASSHHLNCPQ